MDGGNMINPILVEQKRKQRADKIETYAATKKLDRLQAAMFIDLNGPTTTNKKMLHQVGCMVEEVTEDNFQEIVFNLSLIGVSVIFDETRDSPQHLCRSLNKIINEEITECWGGPDMQEYVEIYEETNGTDC